MLINQEAKQNLLLISESLHTLPRNLPESNWKALPCGFGNNGSELVWRNVWREKAVWKVIPEMAVNKSD